MQRKIFLDCGANLGQSTLAWMKYVENSQASIVEQKYDICAFEPSIYLQAQLRTNLKDCENVKIFKKVVWTHNQGVVFGDRGNESSSTEKDKLSGGAPSSFDSVYESIDLSEFIKNNFQKSDYIVLKMDIEGGEYHLLPHLYKNGALEYVDMALIELHGPKLHSKSIEDDYSMLKILEESKIPAYFWSADWAHKNENFKKRTITREKINAFWKKKGR